MSITITFDNYEEMEAFARKVLKEEVATRGKAEAAQAVSAHAAPLAQAVPVVQPAPAAPTAQPVPVAAPAQAVPAASPAQPASSMAAAAPTPVPPVQVPQAVPTSSRTYTPDELAKAAMQLMDSGRQSELIGLLSQFGVDSLPSLRPDQYGAFATALRGMGAQI